MPKRQKAPSTTAPPQNQGQHLDVSHDVNLGLVTLKFDAPVTFMRFSPADAKDLAKSLIEAADQLQRKNKCSELPRA
jgi:hypothetical protein